MHRRGFLGSVIGLVAAQSFLAKAAFEKPQRAIKPYRMCFVTDKGLIQAPAVKEVLRDGNNLTFNAEKLDFTQTMTVTGMKVYDEDWKFIGGGDFSCWVPIVNGDALNGTLTISTYDKLPPMTEKEIIKMIVQAQEAKRVASNS